MNARRFLGMIGVGFGVALTLSACSGNDGLRQLNKPKTGPDEFRVLPAKPLLEPDSFTTLPLPTPGGANRTDQVPAADAVVALGGRASALESASGIPSGDTALVRQASRHGVTPNIREELAVEDADFRKRRGRFTNIRIVKVDRYKQAYEEFALDPFAEAERFRKLGLRTPAAPPSTPQ